MRPAQPVELGDLLGEAADRGLEDVPLALSHTRSQRPTPTPYPDEAAFGVVRNPARPLPEA